jgi:CRP-like cAMP-binding protein
MPAGDDDSLRDASVSGSLATLFRGRFCETLLLNRSAVRIAKGEALYEAGEQDRTFFFIQRGLVKLGTVTEDGHEIIYDLRKAGDVVGELAAYQSPRRDRAVALEPTDVVAVPYEAIIGFLQENPVLLRELIEVLCGYLSHAYEQVSRLAADDTVHRLVKVLLDLAARLGRRAGRFTELATYLTQEELSQMVAARRERVSTALNLLRRGGLVRYSRGGHLLLDVEALENYRP